MAKSPTMERIENAVEGQLHSIKFNLQRVFRDLLWSLVLEAERTDLHGGRLGTDIDTVVREVVNTSYFNDNGGSTWDSEKTDQAVANLKAALKVKGICNPWRDE